ncbi:protein EARLY-RESPONSIVE TO DEHYDRATION 7, chloroplastic isoform X1 [Physcomitrium patens]|uniref:Senescence domain-containing protein n=2 Tax=Physcomitrium patens TaxID=3218 RepID=A0A2K1KCE9_PHYPA|nr:protein EARLY-RESPONSIVE TO DEHYDRATION 7, chloroplastic-like isoform X1 [Physcomitrium patens]PNR51447.1 hypothetical protein PHYPA_010634 [Physcomitrium patens]|eukprot:XP_024379847.1 protein EARLY-RESPONSIVE TO DEHYDRATION 7, chloroplastic-like isoform X1 [Physcomitrella patens]
MDWLRRNDPFEYDKDRIAAGSGYYPAAEHVATSRSVSMDPGRSVGYGTETPEIFRAYSMRSRRVADPPSYDRYSSYPEVPVYELARNRSAGELHHEPMNYVRATSNTSDFSALRASSRTEPAYSPNAEVTETSEEVLVRVRGAVVHLVDDEESPLLAEGSFSVVLIEQEGNGIVAFVKVGDNLRWPLTKDALAVKLDSTHYFFTIHVPRPVDEMDKETADGAGGEALSYGVTFSVTGQERELLHLDSLLEKYSNFSNPQLVHDDRQKSNFDRALQSGAGSGTAGVTIPEAVVSSKGKRVTEGNQAEFWKTMAPNVNDYNSRLAKGMAKGTGNVIKGIFWVRDVTVARLENGSIYMKGKVKPCSKPSKISPRTLRNLKRVENMSKATEEVAKNVLDGVVKTVGFFSQSLLKSKPGKKFFSLLPGEVALASMDAFAKVFDAMEKAGSDMMQSTAVFTQDVVSHRYGEGAGQVAENTMSTAGHVMGTAWTVSKVRKALNLKTSKSGMFKAAVKQAVGAK